MLPTEKDLLGFPDLQAIIAQHKLSVEGIRAKIVRQFKNWGETKKSAGPDSNPSIESVGSVSIFVLSRAGNAPDIVRAALDDVSVGPLIRLMPWAKSIQAHLKSSIITCVHVLKNYCK